MTRDRIASLAKVAGINLGLLLLGIVALELAFGSWWEPYLLPDARMVNQKVTYRQQLYQPESTLVYTRDKYGLRSVNGPITRRLLRRGGGSGAPSMGLSLASTGSAAGAPVCSLIPHAV